MIDALNPIDVLDLTDLPTACPIWIYGAGPKGRDILCLVRALPDLQIKGFFDTFKTGTCDDMQVIHPKNCPDAPEEVAVLHATSELQKVLALLDGLGIHRVFDLDIFLTAYGHQKNIHYLPQCLPNGAPEHPLPFEEGRIRAVGARVLVLKKQLEPGFTRLRKLATECGIIHVEDDIAGCALRQSMDHQLLASYYDEAVKQGIMPGEKLDKEQEDAIARGIPPIFINTILKSGTGFFTKVFKDQLHMPQFFTTLRGSPNDYILPTYMKKFARGGAITVQHLDASAANLDTLADCGVKKIFLHIRDPRQATVSYLHHLENNLSGELFALRNWIHPFLPHNYPSLEWKEKVAWHARNHVITLIHWIQEWLYVADNDPRFDIMILDFNELRRDEAGTINKVMRFFDLGDRVTTSDIPDKK